MILAMSGGLLSRTICRTATGASKVGHTCPLRPHGRTATAPSGSETYNRQMQSNVRHIYVALMDQTGEKWQRVEAVSEDDDVYRITSTPENPDERWEYGAGTVVRCRATTLPSGERVLVATERLNPGRSGVRPPPPLQEDPGGPSGW